MIATGLEINPNTFYTPDEAASLLRVSRKSIADLLKNGRARDFKIGRTWRILGSDLLRLPSYDEIDHDEIAYGLMRLSEATFARVWDNNEDSVYDDL